MLKSLDRSGCMLFGDNQLNLGPFKQVAVNGHDRIRGSRYTPPDQTVSTAYADLEV